MIRSKKVGREGLGVGRLATEGIEEVNEVWLKSEKIC